VIAEQREIKGSGVRGGEGKGQKMLKMGISLSFLSSLVSFTPLPVFTPQYDPDYNTLSHLQQKS